jgi:hypothetical protein
VQHYQRALAHSAEAKSYAAARLISPAAIEHFRLEVESLDVG